MRTAGLSLILSASQLLAAAEWNQFRGLDGRGVAEAAGVPAAPTEKDIAWTFSLPGKGHSSPVAWGTKVFVTAEDAGKPGTRHVICVNAETGKELWRYQDTFETYRQHQLNSYAASTPVADANRVYVSWLSGTNRRVLALDHSGKKVWEKTPGFYQEQHGSSSSPILVDGLLIVPNDHANGRDAGFFGLDARTGETKWKIATSSETTAFSTPLVITGADGKRQLVVSSQPASLKALDPLTGKVLWEVEHSVPKARAVSMPVLADGGLIFATVGQAGTGRGAVAVRPGSADGSKKPEVVWEASNRIPYVPTPVAIGRHLYVLSDGGLLSCVRAADGERVWEERGPGEAYSSLVAVNGVLYAVSRKGVLMTARAGEKFEPLGQLNLGEGCQTTPAVAAGRLIVRTDTKLIAIGNPPSAVKP
jgi:outer membrane protein assembly factor BamB